MGERALPARIRRLGSAVVRALPFLGALSLYLLLGLILWWTLNWYIEPNKAPQPSTAKKDLFQALGFLMAGVAGAVGVYFTWRNLSQTRESTERTLWLTEQGQITERFTRAIEQLGATTDDGRPKLEIRLGGIYALERIARDSPERDYSTVMEVLTAYVREHAKLPSEAPGEDQNAAHTSREVRAEVQAIIDVLGRQHHYIPERYRIAFVLHATDLRGASLKGAQLRGAYLDMANLMHADLREVQLSGADLRGADLREADLREADLRGADFTGANLKGANLSGANLEGARLDWTRLGGARLTFANLSGAYLERADLSGASLSEAKLRKAYLRDANLRGADLTTADLSGAILRSADLEDANLITAKLLGAQLDDVNLERARLMAADLGGANFRGARGLDQQALQSAEGDETTTLPEGVARPGIWRRNA